jgi:catechol 2,3-dioxygenase-like lactoylglutathione lyase family enzyme
MSLETATIGAITLLVEDLPAARSFYHDVFGKDVMWDDANSAGFRFGDTVINLLQVDQGPSLIGPARVAGPDAGARMQLTIWVEDTDTTIAELKARGVELINGPIDRAWGQRTAAFADPAGHIWEIAQSIPAQ